MKSWEKAATGQLLACRMEPEAGLHSTTAASTGIGETQEASSGGGSLAPRGTVLLGPSECPS